MTNKASDPVDSGYVLLDGMKMYYEVYGSGNPLVLIHGGGSTIDTTFSNIIPLLAENRQVIAMELQAHGRSGDRDAPLSFAQSANDVVALMTHLGIDKADVLGFSNGGQVLIEMGLRHAERIRKMILVSTFYKRNAAPDSFWNYFEDATLDTMPAILKDSFLKVNGDPQGLQNMFDKDVRQMQNFTGWTDEQLQSIGLPVLIMNATMDVSSMEHAMEMHRNLPHSELVILPGRHGEFLGTLESLPEGRWTQKYVIGLLEQFLGVDGLSQICPPGA